MIMAVLRAGYAVHDPPAFRGPFFMSMIPGCRTRRVGSGDWPSLSVCGLLCLQVRVRVSQTLCASARRSEIRDWQSGTHALDPSTLGDDDRIVCPPVVRRWERGQRWRRVAGSW